MELWDVLRHVWFVLLGVLFLGYSILDGFDLGVGVLFPFLAKKEGEKEGLIQSVGPFWDGNEVWLLTGGGALFAAFPQAYATVFSGFYLALMLVLFALIFRAVSLEFRAHDPRRRGFWEGCFVVGSFLPSLLFGVALGNVIQGVPLNANMDFTGTFFTLFRPFPVALGLLGLAAILLQGAAFILVKQEGEIRERTKTFVELVWVAFALLFIISMLLSLFYIPWAPRRVLPWVFTAVVIICLFGMRAAVRRDRDGPAFALSSGVFAGLWGIAGSVMYPYLVRASGGTAPGLDIFNASSSRLTLTVMLVIALVGMPLVVAYTIYLYRIFRGRVRPEEGSYQVDD
jgi:cytochrome d ubiquinol oxidase subunit II